MLLAEWFRFTFLWLVTGECGFFYSPSSEVSFPFPGMPEPGETDEAHVAWGRASKSVVLTQRTRFARSQSLPELRGTLDAHSQTLLCYTETVQREVMPPNPRRGNPCASAVALALR